MKIECGGLLFTSDFDSGNLDKVEFVEPAEKKVSGDTLPPISRCVRRQKSHPESPVTSPVLNKKYPLKRRTLYSKLKSTVSADSVCGLGQQVSQPIREFKVWTKPDCSGTPYQTTFRTWFYFGISGGPPGLVVKINVMNLNRQGKLYFHGMKPVYKIVPSKDNWKRIHGKVDFRCGTDGNFTISFCHTLPSDQDSVIYFAFTYPFSYSECQRMLDEIDEKVGTSLYISKSNKPQESALYYSRELLCCSPGGNHVDLLTISSCKGLTSEREERLAHLFPDHSKPRCHLFQNKKVVFISSRVHPGETPSSFVLNGMLHYLTCSKETAANRLRNLFVFKLIPMLNPDGVRNGHYRADTNGLNLNRIYMVADTHQHPSIYAARTLLLHYHTHYSSPNQNKTATTVTNQKQPSPALTNQRLQRTAPKSVLTNQKRVHAFGDNQKSVVIPNLANQKQYSGTNQKHPVIMNPALANQKHVRDSASNQKRPRNVPTKLNLKSPTRKLSKDILNQMQKKTVKHSLHTCDILTKNLNFLSSVPVVLPAVPVKSQSMVCDSANDLKTKNSPVKPFEFGTSRDGHSLEEMKDATGGILCSECKQSDFPSKKITLESDQSCNCIEPSDADDSSSFDLEARLGEGDASKLLEDIPPLRPEESGIAYYFDLHGHASKRGCFIYGNYFPDIDKMVDCMFLPKLMSINCPYFDFSACNFSAENMYSGTHSNVQSKEGSGRVSLYVLTGIIHSYTLECNYNTCRFTPDQKRPKRVTGGDVPSQVFFTPEIFHQIGESLLTSILDAVGHNPKSQIGSSQFVSIQGVREWLKQHALSVKGRCAPIRKPPFGLRASDKVLTRSMTIRRSLFSPSNKGLRQESSSSTNLSSTESEGKTRSKAAKSLISSPVSRKAATLQRRHTFVQDTAQQRKLFRKPSNPTEGRSSTA